MNVKNEDRFESWWQKEYPEFQGRSISNVKYQKVRYIAEAAWDAALDGAEEIVNQTFDEERKRREQDPVYSLSEIRDAFLCTFAGAMEVWFGDSLDETGETEEYWKELVGHLQDRGRKE